MSPEGQLTMDTQPTILGGRYQLGPALGRGGMAEVNRARDLRLQRDVAIKRLRIDLPRSDVIQWYLADGTLVTVRPSGTEPKIKFYILARTVVSAEGLDAARAESAIKIRAIEADLKKALA